MCGIIGLVSKKTIDTSSYLSALRIGLDKMEYRGPDNAGLWQDDQVLLGHRRLSIIDLSDAGNQPFTYSNDRFVIVFNGEIYNFRELKDELLLQGHQFRTETDTEVIIAAYVEYGKEFCKAFRGMFALVLYDRQEKELVFSRDRLGKKPLFLYENEDVLIFASEIKFFHAFAQLPLDIDETSLLNFLSLQYIPGPATIYKQVRQLPPGQTLIWNTANNNTETFKYWDIFEFVGTESKAPEPEEVDELLQKSIHYRLVANVDVGLLLSGGIDSSLLACYMEQFAGKKVKAFNVGFANKAFDESIYAQKVARALELDLISLSLDDIKTEHFSQAIFHGDQPLGDSAIIPTYLIAKSIGKHVKVVLSGEGADELFHGYDHYSYEEQYYRLGSRIFTGAENISSLVSALGIKKLDKLKNKLRSINSFKEDVGVTRWTSILSPELTVPYLSSFAPEREPWEYQFQSLLKQLGKKAGKLESSLMLDLLTWLPDDLLVKTDRMMMAASVEARTPFLDHKLVERIVASSDSFNDKNFKSKNYLRTLLKKRLPAEVSDLIANRSKQGFETPKISWMTGSLSEASSELFSAENLKKNPYLDAMKIETLWQGIQNEIPGTNNRLAWNVFCFLEWYRQHENKFGFR